MNDGSTLPSLTISPLVSTTYDVEYNLDGCIGTSVHWFLFNHQNHWI